MSEGFKLAWESSLQQKALHEIAKICWGKFALRERYMNVNKKKTILEAYRDDVINRLPKCLNVLPKAFSAPLPKQLLDKVIYAVICLQRGYKEAVIWEEKCSSDLPFTTLNPITAGKYQAGYFIDPTGHFNDFAWAKQFVADENQPLDCRFVMACLYCFKEPISNIWNIMKDKEQLFSEGNLVHIKYFYGHLIGTWVYELKIQTDEFVEIDSDYGSGNYFLCLEEAITDGHEYAGRYFWSLCSGVDREIFLKNLDLDYLHEAAKNDYTGILYFIYSNLSEEQKNILIRRFTFGYTRSLYIWSCLLNSPFYKSILSDILNFSFPISAQFYSCVLIHFAYSMREFPIHEKSFKVLWSHLLQNQQKEILENGYIISFLARLKIPHLVEFINHSLTNLPKGSISFEKCLKGGLRTIIDTSNFRAEFIGCMFKSIIKEERFSHDKCLEDWWETKQIISEVIDYNSLRLYLLFYLSDLNPLTHKLGLRDNALEYIDNFFNEFTTKYEFCELAKVEVHKARENLQGSLSVLHQLLENVEEVVHNKIRSVDE